MRRRYSRELSLLYHYYIEKRLPVTGPICFTVVNGTPGFHYPTRIHEEKITMSKAQIKFYAQYVRYALPALASVVFRLAVN